MFRKSLLLGVILASLCALQVAAAQGAQATAHDPDHTEADDHDHDELVGARLLIGEAGTAQLYVLDLDSGEVIAHFTAPGPSSIYQLPDPRYAVAVHRADNRVSIIHSGLTAVDHGDHADLLLGNPHVLATLNVGRQPTHVFARGTDLAFFSDQDGTVAWLDARLLGISLDYAEIVAREPGHGAMAVLDGHMVVGLPDGGVDVYTRDGRSVAHFSGCPGLHGQAALSDTVTFGCSDGVIVIRSVGAGLFTAHKLANPPRSPEGARVSTLTSDDDSAVLVGNFGQGIAVIDPVALTITTHALPTSQIAGRIYEHGELYVHLGVDGNLRSIDPATGEVLAIVAVSGDSSAQGSQRPTLTVFGSSAYVTDPVTYVVREIDLEHFEEERHFHLTFMPSGVALMAIPGAVAH